MVEDCFPIPICPLSQPFRSYSPSVLFPPTIRLVFFSFLFCLCPQFLHSAPYEVSYTSTLCQPQPCCSSSGCGCQRGSVANAEQNLPKKLHLPDLSSVAGRNSCSKCCITLWVRIDTHQVHREAVKHFAAKLKKFPLNVGNLFLQASSEYSSSHGEGKRHIPDRRIINLPDLKSLLQRTISEKVQT